MTISTERISGYADALQAMEDAISNVIGSAGAQTGPGLGAALIAIQEMRVGISDYYGYLCNLREEQEAEWGDYAETETDCAPCLAETAPHTCIQPW